jgi:hypothetical protein
MAIRVTADKQQPSATIEIPLEKPLPDYDLNQLEHPTPRDVDAILVSQGFRDLVDDARHLPGRRRNLSTGPLDRPPRQKFRPGPRALVRFTNAYLRDR